MWLMILCSLVMALGTSIGGIPHHQIRGHGHGAVWRPIRALRRISARRPACLLSSVTGVPVSTTHTKTTAIMGVGALKRLSAVNLCVVKDMMLAWVLTFPGCGLISFAMAKLFMMVF